MVNICGKCQSYMKTRTPQDGHYYHYCYKADKLFPSEQASDGEEHTDSEVHTLKVKFNDKACNYYQKKRR